jgi:hypothetical protein
VLSQGRAALRALYPKLLQLPREHCIAPRGITPHLLAEAERIQGLLVQQEAPKKLCAVGVDEQELADFGRALLALRYIETCVRNAATAAAAEPLLLEQALQVRDELVVCCRFNLRTGQVAEALARITDSDDPGELAMDLRELARLVRENASAFARDRSIDVGLFSVRALDLANSIAGVPAVSECVRSEWCELRARAHGYLISRMRRIEEAGTYAFRGTERAHQWVCCVSGAAAPASSASRLRTLLLGSR